MSRQRSGVAKATISTSANEPHVHAYPSSHAFDIVSFNLLAPVYKRLASKNAQTGRRHREAGDYGLWSDRLSQTMDFFRNEIYKDTAIIGLQEYWLDTRYRRMFEEQFAQHGYEVHVMQRTGTKVDAVALVIKKDVFEICGSEHIDLCTFGDRVALLLWLRHQSTGFDLLVANTHLSFPHNVLDRMNQVAQMKHLTSVIDKFSRTHGIEKAPALILGDFNVESQSPVCDHLRSSGYHSCFEVCPPGNTEPSSMFMNYSSGGSGSGEGKKSKEELEEKERRDSMLVSVSTHETCILPSEAADSVSKRHMFECDDIGDACVEIGDASIAAAASSSYKASGSDRATVSGGIDASVSAADVYSSAYVSHYNHRNEEVGVDHIFLRPIMPPHSEDESLAWDIIPSIFQSNKANKSSSLEHSSLQKGGCGIRESRNTQESALERAKEKKIRQKSNIFVAECQVLPKGISCSTWFSQFYISDHRPVRTKMVFTQDHLQNPDSDHVS
eukprot:CAMPEP_0170368838 /NCGR_PEP_ID=MMETSP0117_2-20130122/7665_1 /TAXON_ID=400756 /ORGANISM="Durinskia baltica, Strain CSIRO CS-38" /LENGTH=498 /DNA_ID=CAMNT_0010623521 /DNA_START=316 /DNA_END=1812 /DNA_ORIENTATION=-